MNCSAVPERVHSWSQSAFEPSYLYQGYLTAVQFYQCRACKEVVGLPLALKPHTHGCTGHKEIPKVKWQAPMPPKTKDVEKRDYPKKREKR